MTTRSLPKESPVRVLHVDTGEGWRGGQQQVLFLLEGCREENVVQHLLAPADSSLLARARQAGIPATPLPSHGISFESLRVVRRLAAEHDVMHAHDSHAHSLACAAQPFGGPAVRSLIVSRRVGFPIGSLGRAKYRYPARFIAVSEFVRWRLMEAEVPEEKIAVILDGVRVPVELAAQSVRAGVRQRHAAGEEAFVLGTLSGFAPEKQLPETLAVLRQLPPEVHFWLGVPAGVDDPGSAGAALLDAAKSMGLSERFRIVPVSDNPGPFLAALDVFVYLSRMEGLGSAILLAMAHALPVVASKVGGIPEIVRHGHSGILVEPGAESEIPAAIQLLRASPKIRHRMATQAREFAFTRGSSDRMVAQTVLLYQGLVQGSGGRGA